MNNSNKSRRGFAAMSPEKQAAIASMGGKAAHEKGVSSIFTSEQAKVAGQKGGSALVAKRGSAYMAEIGRKGGKVRTAKSKFVPPETMKDLFEEAPQSERLFS